MWIQLGIMFFVIFAIAGAAVAVQTHSETVPELGLILGLALFSFMSLFECVLFTAWFGIKPLLNILMLREHPGRYSEMKKIRLDGAVVESLEENPKESFWNEKDKNIPGKKGVQITKIFHRNAFFGNPVHFLIEGVSENVNLLQKHKPVGDAELQDAVIASSWMAGYREGVADTQVKKKGIFDLQTILSIVTIIAIFAVAVLVFQNQEALTKLAESIAKMTVVPVGQIIQGA